jgi:glutaconyl-CoA/methylmalonyl-CoA decarboxylase subunit gamma
VRVESERMRSAEAAKKGKGGSAEQVVKSPMPGRVVKVLVKPGDEIAVGQALVVIEAMKMENELKAPRAGGVLEVRCVEGAAVEAGQDLVSMR